MTTPLDLLLAERAEAFAVWLRLAVRDLDQPLSPSLRKLAHQAWRAYGTLETACDAWAALRRDGRAA